MLIIKLHCFTLKITKFLNAIIFKIKILNKYQIIKFYLKKYYKIKDLMLYSHKKIAKKLANFSFAKEK